MKSILRVHSDVEDEFSENLDAAIIRLVDSANGIFGYVMGDPDLLEHYCAQVQKDYLALGKALAEVTERYEHWNDPSDDFPIE